MSEKKVIKVVKREERNSQQKTGDKVKSAGETAQQAARDMVNTVTNWVSEFQQKRRVETQALAKLINDPA
ncbi:MAG: hypothetical protein QOD75_2316 [Blastocatellia bacterium]|jgi:hypothetical protein|nr:hypothetical protein [Blastocatellia bacterium]